MLALDILFLNGESLTLEVESCGDQLGIFSWGGEDIINQAKRYGYVAARNGVALALNGEAGVDTECYPMASIKRMKLRKVS